MGAGSSHGCWGIPWVPGGPMGAGGVSPRPACASARWVCGGWPASRPSARGPAPRRRCPPGTSRSPRCARCCGSHGGTQGTGDAPGTPKAPRDHQRDPDVREKPQCGDPGAWGPQTLPMPTKGIQMTRDHPNRGTQVLGDPKSSPCPPVTPRCSRVPSLWGPKYLGTPNTPSAHQGDPDVQGHPIRGPGCPGTPNAPHAHQGDPDVHGSPQYGDPGAWGP